MGNIHGFRSQNKPQAIFHSTLSLLDFCELHVESLNKDSLHKERFESSAKIQTENYVHEN